MPRVRVVTTERTRAASSRGSESSRESCTSSESASVALRVRGGEPGGQSGQRPGVLRARGTRQHGAEAAQRDQAPCGRCGAGVGNGVGGAGEQVREADGRAQRAGQNTQGEVERPGHAAQHAGQEASAVARADAGEGVVGVGLAAVAAGAHAGIVRAATGAAPAGRGRRVALTLALSPGERGYATALGSGSRAGMTIGGCGKTEGAREGIVTLSYCQVSLDGGREAGTLAFTGLRISRTFDWGKHSIWLRKSKFRRL